MNPNPQDPLSPLYDFIDTQPLSAFPNNPDTSPSHFTVRQKFPTSVTASLPIVVTIAAHGWLNGQAIRALQFLDGMQQLNNRLFYVQQATTDTFQLYDENNLPIDGSNYTPFVSGGQLVATGVHILCVNPSNFPPPGIVL